MPELKALFLERIKELLPNKEDFQNYLKILQKEPPRSIRCNTLKITPEKLKKKFENKEWKIFQPWSKHQEVIIIGGYKNGEGLAPGELGRAYEHLLGYYYVQELASMLPVLSLNPKKNELVLDLTAAPGSKTTQIASFMKNQGLLIANDVSLGRIKILASNLERCGVTNCIITRKEGFAFCKRLAKIDFKMDKILIDAPCSGEGTLRSTPKTALMWNINTVKNLSRIQKKLISSAIEILKTNGELVYSTCTHAPEENEEVIDFILKNFPKMKIQKLTLPSELKFRHGITKWQNKKFLKDVKYSARIYPQDNNTEGFFIAKLKKTK